MTSAEIRASLKANFPGVKAKVSKRGWTNSNDPYAHGYSAGFLDGLKALAESMGLRFVPGQSNTSIGRRWDG